MYNLIEYSANYSNKSEILRQYYRDELSKKFIKFQIFIQGINNRKTTAAGYVSTTLVNYFGRTPKISLK